MDNLENSSSTKSIRMTPSEKSNFDAFLRTLINAINTYGQEALEAIETEDLQKNNNSAGD